MNETSPRFSLLFANPQEPKTVRYKRELLNFLAPIPWEHTEQFFEILQYETTRKDIALRKEILEDFLQYPGLFTVTETILRRWEGLFETAKREISPSETATMEEAFDALRENSISLMEHLKFLRISADEMQRQTPASEGLFTFAEYLRIRANLPQIKELTEQISAYPMLRPETARAVLHVHLNRYGMQTVSDVAFLGTDEGKYRKKHPVHREDFTARIPKDSEQVLSTTALVRLANQLRALSHAIRQAFLPLKEGLEFYRCALSLTEWASTKGDSYTFATLSETFGPTGKGIRSLSAETEISLPPLDFTPRALETYEGERGSQTLKTIARLQILSAAGLPFPMDSATICPDQRILGYSSEGKTMDEEIQALADLFRETRRGDIILLNRPLITVGNAPAAEIVENLLKAFYKKGAFVRIASNLSIG